MTPDLEASIVQQGQKQGKSGHYNDKNIRAAIVCK
jgi:hypothetical protein